ncbi:hypothetical protein [Sediminitomix flava]|uniref:Uncharacterized protein n=1 Tax=Sediminitomix flava TaxID=379075 RepID=A0A315ZID3_SEDFL|nr:hypothetical protein [Sediminitomix flava]PWJ44973.1 hypothetical protein BC781_1011369 [Sediminitomix flava]
MNSKTYSFKLLDFATDFVVMALLLAGIYFAQTDLHFLEKTILIEDGMVENATVLFLLVASVMTVVRIFKYASSKSIHWLVMQVLMASFFLFIAGEEMSWGQRIWNVETNEFFQQYNLQGETNLHNMKVGDVKINTLIFGKLITVVLIIHLCITPFLYRKKEGFRNLVNKWGVPIGYLHHGIVFLIFSIGLNAIPTGSKWELYEVVISIIVLSIIYSPMNKEIYQSKKHKVKKAQFSM